MITLVSQERKSWPQPPSPGTLTGGGGLASPPWLSARLARGQAGSRRSGPGKLQPEIARPAACENKPPPSDLPPARSRPLGPLREARGRRRGNGLNIWFCSVPLGPLAWRPNLRRADRRAPLQKEESCYSTKRP